jgi:drug/metabolite transporter superfamily protein YnfA
VSAAPAVFLGTALAAVTSAYLCQQAWREGQRALAWTMGLASGAFFIATLIFASQL